MSSTDARTASCVNFTKHARHFSNSSERCTSLYPCSCFAIRARWQLGRTERPFGGHFTFLECCIKFQLEVYASMNGCFMLAHYVQELHLMMGLGVFIFKIEMSCWKSNMS